MSPPLHISPDDDGIYFIRTDPDSHWMLTSIKGGLVFGDWIAGGGGRYAPYAYAGVWSRRYDKTEAPVMDALADSSGYQPRNFVNQIELLENPNPDPSKPLEVRPVTAKCMNCAQVESPGFATGCLLEAGHDPDNKWACDGKGNLKLKTHLSPAEREVIRLRSGLVDVLNGIQGNGKYPPTLYNAEEQIEELLKDNQPIFA